MPSRSNSATSALTWSRMDIPGNRAPHGRPSGPVDAGPVLPLQPPRTLVAMTHHSSVSSGAPGPATPSHQPGSGCRPSGAPTTCESPVSACSTSTTLSAVGDSSPQRCTASSTPGITAPLSRRISPMLMVPSRPSGGGSSRAARVWDALRSMLTVTVPPPRRAAGSAGPPSSLARLARGRPGANTFRGPRELDRARSNYSCQTLPRGPPASVIEVRIADGYNTFRESS